MRIAVFTAAFLALASTAIAGAPAPNPFLGSWIIAEAKPGPWVKPGETPLTVDPKLLKASVTFGASSIKGPAPLGCAKVIYTLSAVGPEDLFQGGLTDPHNQAAALGFTSDKITSLNEGCSSSSADIEMDYALVDQNTAVFGLNDHVYVMKRVH